MRFFRFTVLVIFALLAACSTGKQSTQLAQNASLAFMSGDYAQALEHYETFIFQHGNNPLVIPDSIYRGAGLAAFELDQPSKALDYLNTIRHSEAADAPVQYALALLNRQIDNLSREITALEHYVTNFPQGEHHVAMQLRLFEVWVESQNYQDAVALWPSVKPHASAQESYVQGYFIAQQALGNEDELDALADQLLNLNRNNTLALFHLGKKHFWMAENRYRSEMQAYENNRTHRQYAQLLRAFDVLNADFRKSLDYFLKLWEIDPRPEYARFIGNIYTRFEDRPKARYFLERSGQ